MPFYNNKKKIGRDDYETPESVWQMFFKIYGRREDKIWLPFYCKGRCAEYVEKHYGTNYIHNDNDFFETSPEYDVIVDNPPYSCKKEVFERCIALGKPFALYVPLDTMERGYIQKHMNGLDLQIIIPNKRTDFITDYDVAHTTPPHKTIWICWKMKLADGRQIIFE
jgi:hypothetical protein